MPTLTLACLLFPCFQITESSARADSSWWNLSCSSLPRSACCLSWRPRADVPAPLTTFLRRGGFAYCLALGSSAVPFGKFPAKCSQACLINHYLVYAWICHACTCNAPWLTEPLSEKLRFNLSGWSCRPNCIIFFELLWSVLCTLIESLWSVPCLNSLCSVPC